jgi:hypothetical protein
VEGWAPSETKEETAHRVTAGDVGDPAILGTFAHTDRRKMMVIHLNRLKTYQGAALDEWP